MDPYHILAHLHCSTPDPVERVRVVHCHSNGPPQCHAMVCSHLWGQIRHQTWTDCVLPGYAKDDRWVWRETSTKLDRPKNELPRILYVCNDLCVYAVLLKGTDYIGDSDTFTVTAICRFYLYRHMACRWLVTNITYISWSKVCKRDACI